VFEDGQLTDGLGNTVDLKNTIIIMTSNLGARFLEKRGQLGFSAPQLEGIPTKIEDQVMSEVKRSFNPEFLTRLDVVILFTSLPRPAELEVYLGETGIYCRPVKEGEGELVGAGATATETPGTPLYTF